MTQPRPDLIVLRHGETVWNSAGRWQGALDSPLTTRGVAQAAALGAMFRRMGVGPDTHRIVSSPQGRARATARIVFGPDIPEDADLREIGVGAWAGRTRAEVSHLADLPEDADLLTRYSAPPGAEPFAALEARCRQVLTRSDAPTVLVTHGITGRMLRVLAQGRPWQAFQDIPGGQGVAFRIVDGTETCLRPAETGTTNP